MEEEKKAIELHTQIKVLLAPMELNIIYAAYLYAVRAEFSHRHRCHHLIVVTEGEAKIQCDQNVLTLRKGDSLFIPCNIWHHFIPQPNVPIECFVLSFELKSQTASLSEIGDPSIHDLYEIYHKIKQYCSYVLIHDQECADLALQIKHDLNSIKCKKNLYLLSDYIRILTAAFGNLKENPDTAASTTTQSFGNVIAIDIAIYLSTHYTEDIHIADIAKLYNFTPRHLQRIFHEYFGTSIAYSLMLIRLDAARNLLNTTEIPLQDIARKSGFISARALVRALKEIDNKTPSDYRDTLISS